MFKLKLSQENAPRKIIFFFPYTDFRKSCVSDKKFMILFIEWLEYDCSVPLPFCYVPKLEQIKLYKQYNKAIDIKNALSNRKTALKNDTKSSTNTSNPTALQTPRSTITPGITEFRERTQLTVQEFLLSSSVPNAYQEHLPRPRNRSGSRTRQPVIQANNNREVRLNVGDHRPYRGAIFNRINESISELISSRSRSQSNHTTPPRATSPTLTERSNSPDEVNLSSKTCNDIFEHINDDKLWEMVVDYYYSLSSSTDERKKQCFQLKGIDIFSSSNFKLDRALFTKKNFSKNKNIEESSKEKPVEELLKSPFHLPNYEKEAEETLRDMIDKICKVSNEISEEKTSVSIGAKDTADISDSIQKTPKSSKGKQYIDIETDDYSADRLSKVGQKWTKHHDLELISFLSNCGKDSDKSSVVREKAIYYVR